MAEYRRNHFIPESMLDYWATKPADKPYSGVWVYEIDSKKKYFANGDGGSAYSFAVRNDLYVPLLDNERATALERWLSSLEGALATFSKQVHKRSEAITFSSRKDITKTLMALFSLECRSPHNIKQVKAAIERDPKLLEVIAANPGASLHQLVLENLVAYVTEHANRFALSDATILHVSDGSALLSDRPFFNHPGLEPRFLALTSKSILALEPSSSPFRYQYRDGDPEFIHTLNERVALEARAWIAATTETVLDRYISTVESDEWRQYRESESIRVVPVHTLTSGWSIPKDPSKKPPNGKKPPSGKTPPKR